MLKTKKGKDMLCYDGHIFLKEKKNDTKSIWKCNQYYKNKCRGRLHQSEGKILNNADHNHVPSSSEIQVKKTLNNIKEEQFYFSSQTIFFSKMCVFVCFI